MNNTIPPLPPIDGDLILDVFTRQYHRTRDSPSDNTEHGGPERLAELGESVLSMVVMYILFHQRPLLSAADLTETHKNLISHQNIKQWLSCYALHSRVRGLDDGFVLDNPEEARSLFCSYVAAVYIQKGLSPLLEWIRRLALPELEAVPLPGTAAIPAALPGSPPPYTSPPPPPSQATSAPRQPQASVLALFNQTCSQRGLHINWESVSDGLEHQPRWSAKCYVNNQLKGTGAGRTLKLAKEEAARNAFQAMGWGTFSL